MRARPPRTGGGERDGQEGPPPSRPGPPSTGVSPPQSRPNALIVWLAAGAGLIVCALVGLGAGGQWLNPLDPASALDERILRELRWPRVQTAATVGALLALAGACLQVLLGNPLAEPYVLGIAGSSSIGAIAGLALWPQASWSVSGGAFLGACIGVACILPFQRLGPHRLLLAGVVLAALWGATLTVLLATMPERNLGRALGWMMGSLAGDGPPAFVLWLTVAGVLLAGIALAPAIDRLLLGPIHAETLGTSVRAHRLALLVLASVATAVAVATAGTIGFVGLVVPHAMRLLVGPLHRRLLPATALAGAALLLVADAGSRVVIAPAELPIGAVTAVIGVPVFLWLLMRRTSRWS